MDEYLLLIEFVAVQRRDRCKSTNRCGDCGFFPLTSLFYMIYTMVGKENLLGGGDIRMMMAAGLLLGLPQVFMAFYIACVLALVFHGTKIVLKRASHEIAMGPYLASGILILML